MTTIQNCVMCGGKMRAVREKAEMKIGARSAVIEVDRFRCDSCAEVFYTPEQMDNTQRELARQLRSQEKLLEPAQVRAIRDKYELTQAELEQLLGVGPKTVVRWERGTVFQNRATDELLRVIDAVPSAFDFLARKNGVVVSSQGLPCHDEPPRGRRKTVFFSMPQSKTQLGNVSPFPSRPRPQEKAVRPEREVVLPPIPIEAMR